MRIRVRVTTPVEILGYARRTSGVIIRTGVEPKIPFCAAVLEQRDFPIVHRDGVIHRLRGGGKLRTPAPTMNNAGEAIRGRATNGSENPWYVLLKMLFPLPPSDVGFNQPTEREGDKRGRAHNRQASLDLHLGFLLPRKSGIFILGDIPKGLEVSTEKRRGTNLRRLRTRVKVGRDNVVSRFYDPINEVRRIQSQPRTHNHCRSQIWAYMRLIPMAGESAIDAQEQPRLTVLQNSFHAHNQTHASCPGANPHHYRRLLWGA